MVPLPIDASLPEITRLAREGRNVVLVARLALERRPAYPPRCSPRAC